MMEIRQSALLPNFKLYRYPKRVLTYYKLVI